MQQLEPPSFFCSFVSQWESEDDHGFHLDLKGRVVAANILRRVKDLAVFALMHIMEEVPEIQNMQLLNLPSRQEVIQNEVEGLLQDCIIIFKALSHGPKELSKAP